MEVDKCQGCERKGGRWLKGDSCSRWIFLRTLVLSMVGKNAPSFLGLQNLASEHSCVAAAVQAVEMLAGLELVGSLEATVKCLMQRLVRGYPEGWAMATMPASAT